MKRRAIYLAVLVALASLPGCTFAPGCYIGVSLLPPGPFVHCGIDAAPKPAADKPEDDLGV